MFKVSNVEVIHVALGEKIQQLRKASGLSQEQLAEQLNVSRQSISKWELNDSVPEIDKIVLISSIFSVSTDELLKEDNKDQSSSKETHNHISIEQIVKMEFGKQADRIGISDNDYRSYHVGIGVCVSSLICLDS